MHHDKPENIECYRLVDVDDAGITTAIVVPAWGANVIAFSFQAPELAWPIPVLEAVDLATVAMSPTSYGMPILAPTPGRVGRNQSGRFKYRGRDYRITPTRHGFLRNRPWRVTEQKGRCITCVLDVDPSDLGNGEDLFPFEFRAEYKVEVLLRTLRCQLTLRNTGQITQPLNVGWHPYLQRSGPCTVHIPAGSRWELDNEREPTPTGKRVRVKGDDDFREGRHVDCNEHWDDIFTDLDTNNGTVASWLKEEAEVHTKSGQTIRTGVRRTVTVSNTKSGVRQRVRNIQLYTPPGRNSACIEPLSSPPNALNLLADRKGASDVCHISPGGEAAFEVDLGISVKTKAVGDS